jgi:hypothetical protein
MGASLLQLAIENRVLEHLGIEFEAETGHRSPGG